MYFVIHLCSILSITYDIDICSYTDGQLLTGNKSKLAQLVKNIMLFT